MRFEDRKLAADFSGLATSGDQVDEMFAMCQPEGWKGVKWWKLSWICSGRFRQIQSSFFVMLLHSVFSALKPDLRLNFLAPNPVPNYPFTPE